MRIVLAAVGIWLLTTSVVFGARLKDLATLRGDRANQLTGYGLVVGLNGTGDKNLDLTSTSIDAILKTLGVDQKNSKFETKNSAVVFMSAQLPPFAKQGAHIDVTLSSIGTASSLEGGTLVLAPLKGPDGRIYAMAQGKVFIPKKGEGGKSGGGSSTLVGTIPQGAILEKELAFDWNSLKDLKYQLHSADFTTAARIAKRINEELGGKYASASDAGTVDVISPYGFEGTTVELIAQIESIDVEADQRARVVINHRTGTVVLGDDVRLLPVAIAHGGLKVEVKDSTDKNATSKSKNVMLLKGSASVADVVAGLNDTGATSEDLIAVLQSLKASGALVADLEVQ